MNGWRVGGAREQEPYTQEEKTVLMEYVQLQRFRQEAVQAINAANVSHPRLSPEVVHLSRDAHCWRRCLMTPCTHNCKSKAPPPALLCGGRINNSATHSIRGTPCADHGAAPPHRHMRAVRV